jgi:hypothetical protein
MTEQVNSFDDYLDPVIHPSSPKQVCGLTRISICIEESVCKPTNETLIRAKCLFSTFAVYAEKSDTGRLSAVLVKTFDVTDSV